MDINTLAEVLRKEKDSPYYHLQKVGEDFYSQLETYVSEFNKKYPEHSKERRNLEKIIIDLYNARERKIVLNALSFVRYEKEPDIENLVSEEERTLEQVMELLRTQRDKLLKKTSQIATPRENKKTLQDEEKIEEPEKVELELKTVAEPQTSKESEKKVFPKSTVRILEDMPQIVGVDGKTYGSFKPEDVVNLPEANAKIFIKRGVAEFIQFKD